ncbi:hypothetical protein [Streptococcus acidominimus]|uniref:Membrane protein n=1 Tax=Streptococcus acidominimus TaxID=1326 RepID=A0A1Q8ED59_STRAI|nr:hypothetical protein [Streptococcus acidominimus]MBF0846223.1 hypothetical protein [Streptococcus danieliae]MBF0817898.1 hypothetical protein [Streptococcus acidominimus]MBF0838414.1 hypothetical protein [Streptococcus acidominimus]OLF49725.1 hypothetical protein BU200_05875 [Streptococcus acidominimus]TFU31886.1 hypothetical protein E4U01_00265 [Streptococcus acidominimus]
MKKSIKFISFLLTSIILGISTIPSISIAYASEQMTQTAVENTDITPATSLTEEEINTLANKIQSLHQDVSKEWIKEVIERQLQGDYTLPQTYSPFRSAWQGITVNQMGAALDTAISLALGGTTAGLASLIQVKGKHAVKSAIRSAVAKYLGGWIVNSVFIDFAMNLLSPGTYLAQQWDARDAVPNNGRINF